MAAAKQKVVVIEIRLSTKYRAYLCDIYSFLEHHHRDDSFTVPFLHFHVITLHNRNKKIVSLRIAESEGEKKREEKNTFVFLFSLLILHIVKTRSF
jgi:hypothetical protein